MEMCLLFVAADEGFSHFAGDVVLELLGRGLHEIGGGSIEGAADAAVEGQLDTAHRVDNHTGGIGGIPHFELGFQVEGHLAESGAFHTDVAPLAVGQPRHVVAGANVDVVGGQLVRQHAGDGAGLGDLLGLETLALEHVEEVGVAAEVELVGVGEAHAAIDEQAGEHAVQDGGADLGFDVIADDGQTLGAEALAPIFGAGNEHGDGVDEAAARLKHLLHVPLGGHFGANWQVADDDIGLGLFEDFDDVGGGAGGFLDDLGQVLAQPVMGHAAHYGHVQVRDVRELHRVVGVGKNGLGEVFADLGVYDVDCGRKLDVANVIAAQVDVHQAGNPVSVGGIAVELDALHQGRGAVAHANDRDSHFLIAHLHDSYDLVWFARVRRAGGIDCFQIKRTRSEDSFPDLVQL